MRRYDDYTLSRAGPGPPYDEYAAFSEEVALSIKDFVVSASVAAGNVASRERDRDTSSRHDDGRPRPVAERAQGRMKSIVREGTAKLVVSQTAHLGAKELAKRVGQDTLKKIFGALARRPAAAAGSALFAFDVARDSFRLAKGNIDGGEYAERVGGNAVGIAGAAGGAYVGSLIGTLAMPLVGTAVGSVVGGVVGGIGGDTYGRRRVRSLLGRDDDEWEDDEEWED